MAVTVAIASAMAAVKTADFFMEGVKRRGLGIRISHETRADGRTLALHACAVIHRSAHSCAAVVWVNGSSRVSRGGLRPEGPDGPLGAVCGRSIARRQTF